MEIGNAWGGEAYVQLLNRAMFSAQDFAIRKWELPLNGPFDNFIHSRFVVSGRFKFHYQRLEIWHLLKRQAPRTWRELRIPSFNKHIGLHLSQVGPALEGVDDGGLAKLPIPPVRLPDCDA